MESLTIVLSVKNIINSDTAVSSEDGNLVYIEIDKEIDKGMIVELDFSGITMMITAFLNAAIGQLYKKYNGGKLNKVLKLKNVADEDIVLFLKVIDRAKEYFTNKKGFEDSANNAIYGE